MTLTHLTDEALISSFQDTLVEERENLVLQLEHIAEMDRRKLFFHYSSLRAYLVSEKGMEEWQAERKIRLARMLNRFPELKSRLESGKLNPTLVEIVQGCAHREKLSDPEIWELLESISGMSCQSARREIARRYPQSVEMPYDRIRPLTEELSEVRFVANQELLDKLDEIRGLLAYSHPGATLAEVIDVLATEYRERHHPEEKAKRAEARQQKKKETNSVQTPTATWVRFVERRAPSASQKRALIRTAGYQCAYVDSVTGSRCSSKFALETHHLHEWALGGRTELSNLQFLCRNHHRRVTFETFGRERERSAPISA